ncbi:potassium transporter TrkH [Pelagibaculum spongiae]|uniref:Trk system potassium uptake protein n=2 Tax=Pelagibaculum spongiae TaxID=2080658 RepID=A0A2V1H197_9GAMM|nr:potassium transporter TrkH [Pelagibaculum spongiae]
MLIQLLSLVRRFRPVIFILGVLLLALAVTMIIPAILFIAEGKSGWIEFFASAGFTSVIACLCLLARWKERITLTARQMFLLTSLTWIVFSALAALPLMALEHISYTDAFFETMSGVTTTGSTVLSDLENQPDGVLLWRSMLQWMGGIGFIVMAVAILPFLRIGGMRLFQTESSEWTDKSLPKASQVAGGITRVYILLSVACFVAYWLAGMSVFDAVNHSMTTVSTGGYSTWDSSMGHFMNNPTIQWIGTVFMFLGSLPFVLYVAFLGKPKKLLRDPQVRGFTGFLLWVIGGLTLWLWTHSQYDLNDSLRLVAFNVVSVVSTTGYALGDYTQWGGMAPLTFLLLSCIGGCSGSTAGGIKFFRFQVSGIIFGGQFRRMLHGNIALSERYNGHKIDEDIFRSLITFCFFFMLSIAAIAILMAILGQDLLTSLSAAITVIGNVGPGIGEVIGPSGNFASLPDSAKWILSMGMLLGRLEILTVMVMFTKVFWRW